MNLLSIAHPKTGQHWLIWILANYQRLINDKPKMTWAEILYYSKFDGGLSIPASKIQYHSETVNFARIEYPYNFNTKINRFIESFDKTVYIYRNPYDVMISMFYFFHVEPDQIREIREKKDFKDWKFFEDYVKKKIEIYCHHIERSIDYVDLVLYYDDLLKDQSPFARILSWFYGEINEYIFRKTLDLSSFNHVNQLETILKQDKITTQGRKNIRFHARDGRSGQYHELMSIELIDYISKKWEDLKLKVKYKLK